MWTNSNFQLFSSSNDDKPSLGLGFLDSSEPPLPPPPPPIEVLSSEVSSSVKCTVEPVNLDGLTLLKGRVSTKDVLGLPNSDLVPGVYEGGLKLWEGSLDLVKALRSEIQNGHLSIEGKRVLELGCGHGLPGIFACLEGASVAHFQDFNAEVLRCLTIPNVNVNLSEKSLPDPAAEVRFFAGDWGELHQLLPHARKSEMNPTSCSEHDQATGYDVILMAETIYSISAQRNLYGLIKKCLSHPHGVVYMAGKKHYFGVGGGTRQFLSMLEKDGVLASSLVTEVADGSSNVREVPVLDYVVMILCMLSKLVWRVGRNQLHG
ncbi:Nicotinamide N-methyltransferase-like protein [Corchorus olitorius]|uniref:protein-histidine N-methyltransferase n=1 Tax=Corchorus olitorius TaxID=93759 RepID=A0A1R3KQV3_9ROSI|nr:Nicotinamide N-methyltransferase-like protein [Corchorus olitorius]